MFGVVAGSVNRSRWFTRQSLCNGVKVEDLEAVCQLAGTALPTNMYSMLAYCNGLCHISLRTSQQTQQISRSIPSPPGCHYVILGDIGVE